MLLIVLPIDRRTTAFGCCTLTNLHGVMFPDPLTPSQHGVGGQRSHCGMPVSSGSEDIDVLLLSLVVHANPRPMLQQQSIDRMLKITTM